MITITLLNEGKDRYTMSSNSFYLGRKYDDNAQEYQVLFPQEEIEAGHTCKMIVTACNGSIPADTIPVANGVSKYVRSNLSQYDRIEIGFTFEGANGYRKNSEIRYFFFYDAQMPEGFIPATPEINTIVDEAFCGVQWKDGEDNTLQFTNLAGEVKDEINLGEFIQEQSDLAETDESSETFVKNKSTKYLANEGYDGSSPYATEEYADKPKKRLSLERLGAYIYKATFDSIPAYDGGSGTLGGGCSSFIKDGKLYRTFDWRYDNTAEFEVITKNFKGMAFISGLIDGELDNRVEQLPYHLVDGVNNDGIRASTHILYNDWQYEGSGSKNVDLTTIVYHILNELHNINDISTVMMPLLNNIKIPQGLANLGYVAQFLVTDGTTTYALLPPVGGETWTIQNISTLPKLTNFRWLNKTTIQRNDVDLQLRANGIERWNLIGTPSSTNTTLEDLRFTLCYESPNRLSEFIGIDNTTKDSSDAELTVIYNKAHAEYLIRQRNGVTWQSVHSVVYDNKQIKDLYVQEDYSVDYANDDVPTLTSQLTNNGEDGTSPYATVKYVNDEDDSLQGQIDVVNENITNLSEGLNEAQQTIQEHTNDIDQLNNDVADLENEVADALDDISDIQLAIDKNVVSGIGVTTNVDNVSINSNMVNIKTGATSTDTDAIPLANDTTAGLISHSDYQQIRQNTEDIAVLKGQTIRIAYSVKTNPTAQEINDFVVAQGYTQDQFPQIAVVVTGTNYVWRYYENDGWTQQTDVVSIFTNDTAGIIKGSTANGKIYAETDGTGSVNGWDSQNNRITNLENNKADKSELEDYVPTTRTVNNKALSQDISLTAQDVGALPDTATLDNIPDGATRKLSDYVPTTRTINNKALNQNINLDATDVGALPDDTTYVSSVNGQSGVITDIETTTNKTTTLDAQSTNTQYPGAKAVYDYVNTIVGDIDTILQNIDTGSGV